MSRANSILNAVREGAFVPAKDTPEEKAIAAIYNDLLSRLIEDAARIDMIEFIAKNKSFSDKLETIRIILRYKSPVEEKDAEIFKAREQALKEATQHGAT